MHPLEYKLVMLAEKISGIDQGLASELRILASESHHYTPPKDTE